MAFLRKEKKKSGTYLRIAQSYRDDKGNTRHKTLYNMGKAENYSPRTLKKMGQTLIELSGENVNINSSNIKELARFNYGFQQACHRIMQHYELDVLLKNIEQRQQLSYPLYLTVLLMLIEKDDAFKDAAQPIGK